MAADVAALSVKALTIKKLKKLSMYSKTTLAAGVTL